MKIVLTVLLIAIICTALLLISLYIIVVVQAIKGIGKPTKKWRFHYTVRDSQFGEVREYKKTKR